MPLRKLLVGLDLSRESEALLDSLPALHAWGVEELILTHVAAGSPVPTIHRRDATRGVAGRLAEAEAWLEPYFRVELCVAQGNPGRCLAEEAEARFADGIVLGMRRRSSLAEAFVGNTLSEVARRGPRPILVFPHAALEARRTRPILSPGSARLLHPTGLLGSEERSMKLVRELAAEKTLPVTLLHVAEDGVGETGDGKEKKEEKLQRLARELRAGGAPEVEVLLEHGVPWERILARAAEDVRTLIVMGTHARGPVPALILGSQSREVVRRSPFPLFLVPG